MTITQEKKNEVLAKIQEEFDTLTRSIKREVYDQVESAVQDAIDTALSNIADDVADSVSVEVEDKISDMLDNINDAVAEAIGEPIAGVAPQGKVRYQEHQTIISHDTFNSDLQNVGVMIDLILFATQPDCSMSESVRRMEMLHQLANRLKYHTFN